MIRIAAVRVRDRGAGVITGKPATAFVLEFDNTGGRAVDLGTVQVGVTYGADLAASPANQNVGTAHGLLQPGSTRRATYAFRLSGSELDRVSVAVSLDPAHPTVVFTGAAR